MIKWEGPTATPQSVCTYRPSINSITAIVAHPTNREKLYYSSGDGGIRCMDLQREAFDDMFVDKDERSQTSIVFQGADVYTIHLAID